MQPARSVIRTVICVAVVFQAANAYATFQHAHPESGAHGYWLRPCGGGPGGGPDEDYVCGNANGNYF